MTKNCVRFLIALSLVTSAFFATAQPAQSAAGDCVRDTTWTGPNGERLDCYHCKEATYCYPAS